MAASQLEITTYLNNVRTAYINYASDLANAQQLGRTDLDCYKIKFRILKYLVRIITDYFNTTDYETINFFTEDEAEDVMQKINSICGTNYMVNL